MRLISFSPRSRYPSLDLYRYVHLIHAIQYCLHPFDHRSLQPDLCLRRLFCVALDDHLVVADEDWHSPGTPVSTLPQEDVTFLQMR
jgi:hypothetical protein